MGASGEYDRIVRGDYRTREESADARAEAGAASTSTSSASGACSRTSGRAWRRPANRVTEAAKKLTEWLRGAR